MNIYDAIRAIALRDVVKQDDSEYAIRKVLRWYSKTFHTPLHLAEELPIEYVLQAYWEENYENLGPEELMAEVDDFSKSEAQRLEEQKAADAAIADDLLFLRTIEQRQQQTANTLSKIETSVAKLEDVVGKIPPDVTMTFDDNL